MQFLILHQGIKTECLSAFIMDEEIFLQTDLAARREDRNNIRSSCQRQMMQVVATVERASAGTSVGVGVDRCAQNSNRASLVEDFRPASAASRNKGFKTRRGAREVV